MRHDPEAAVSQLRSLLDHDRVGALADDRFFARGQRYAAEDRVHTIEEDDTVIAGTVSGTQAPRGTRARLAGPARSSVEHETAEFTAVP